MKEAKMKKKVRCIFLVMMIMTLTGCLLGCGSENDTVVVGENEEKAEVRTTTCTSCKGSGVCYHCDGESYRDGRRCRICEGNGKCTRCLGEGKKEVLVIDGQDYVYCSMCHGDGKCTACSTKDKSRDCFLCKGSGTCRTCHGDGVTRLSGF